MSGRVQLSPRIPPSSLEDPPLLPHSYDDEFDGVSLDAAWVKRTDVSAFDDVNPIDPYIGFTTGTRTSHNSYRKSWLMFQPGSGLSVYVVKSVTLPSECFVWARASFCYRAASQVNQDALIGLILGNFATANNVGLYLNEPDTNTTQLQADKYTNGAFSQIGVTGNVGGANNAKAQAFCFIGIQKLGTTYHYWAATENGNWQWLGSTTHATAFPEIILNLCGASTASPGNMVCGFDFLRVKSGRYLP